MVEEYHLKGFLLCSFFKSDILSPISQVLLLIYGIACGISSSDSILCECSGLVPLLSMSIGVTFALSAPLMSVSSLSPMNTTSSVFFRSRCSAMVMSSPVVFNFPSL